MHAKIKKKKIDHSKVCSLGKQTKKCVVSSEVMTEKKICEILPLSEQSDLHRVTDMLRSVRRLPQP